MPASLEQVEQAVVVRDRRRDERRPLETGLVPAQADGGNDAGAGRSGLARYARVDDGDACPEARATEARADADDAAADHDDVEVGCTRTGGTHRQNSSAREGTSRRALLPTT